MKRNLFKKNNKGFTIIELMVAIAVFLVVIVIGINALVNMYFAISNSSKVRSLVDNLSFVMDEMSRNIRTGYNYTCVESYGPDTEVGSNCSSFATLYFTETITKQRWGYRIYPSDNFYDNNSFKIQKSVDGGDNWIDLIGENEIEKGLTIKGMSHFKVYGAENTDTKQPFVKIIILGDVKYRSTITPFSLQTGISQMYPDTP